MHRSPRSTSLAWPVPTDEVARMRVVDLQRPLRPQALAISADDRAEQLRRACVVAVMGALGGFSTVALLVGWLR